MRNAKAGWTTGQPHLTAIVQARRFSPVQPHCVNARRNRCQEDLNSFTLGELEETTRTPLFYVDEDYPAGPEIQ